MILPFDYIGYKRLSINKRFPNYRWYSDATLGGKWVNLVVYGYSSIIICGGATGSDIVRMLDQKWRHQKSRDFFPYFFSVFFPPYIFLVLLSHIFFPRIFFSVLFSPVLFCFRTIFPYFFFLYFFPVFFFQRTFFSRTFSNVETFEIQRFKISVSCFSSTCRYNTVHIPCGISIQTSPVGLPLDWWGARMRDLKGPKMNLFNLKEDWDVSNQSYHWKLNQSEVAISGRLANQIVRSEPIRRGGDL